LNGGGNAPFDRYYYAGTGVTITAPDTYGGKAFEYWVVNLIYCYTTEVTFWPNEETTTVVHYAD
jgi:hypothetical protein